MVIYKIRHKKTGLYRLAGGGCPGSWSKTGKAWGSIAQVKGHMNLLRPDTDYPFPKECEDWEVVTFTLVEEGTKSVVSLWDK